MDNDLSRRRLVMGMVGFPTLASTGLLMGCDSIASTIKIGAAQPLSGPLAPLGEDMLNGVKMAVDDLNKEGFRIKGKPVTLEVVSVDDKASADVGKTVAQELVNAGVSVVIGHLNSGVSIAAAPIYAAANIPQLSVCSNPKYNQLDLPTTFRIVANDVLQARAIGAFAIEQIHGRKFAVLDDGSTYGKGLANGAIEQLKKGKQEVQFALSLDDKKTDFSDIVPKIKSAGIDCLICILNDYQMQPLVDELVKSNYTELSILGADLLKTPLLLESSNKIKRIYATSNILEPQEFPAGRAWLERYQSIYKKAPAYGGHYSYDAVFVIAAAFRRAGSTDPQKLLPLLHKVDAFAPVTGSMKWTETGEQRYGVVGVYKATGSHWEPLMRSDAW